MNNKGIKQWKVYIVLVIIFIAALILVFYLLESMKQNRSARPLSTSSTTTKTLIQSSTTLITGTTENNDNDEPVKLVATPFSASLSDIIHGRVFDGKFSEKIIYNNATFTINCNNYDDSSSTCIEGSGLMDYNGALIPIFTFADASSNYLNFARDLYVIIKDNYVFVTVNHVGVSAGKTNVFKTDGTMIGEISNTTTGYVMNGTKIGELYPNFSEDRFNFYYYDNGKIKIGYADITDIKRKVELEIVIGATIS